MRSVRFKFKTDLIMNWIYPIKTHLRETWPTFIYTTVCRNTQSYIIIHKCTEFHTIVHTNTLYTTIHNCTSQYIVIHRCTQLYTNAHLYTALYPVVLYYQQRTCLYIIHCFTLLLACVAGSIFNRPATQATLLYINVQTYPMVAPERILLCEGMGTRRENSSLRLWFLFFLNCFL
jgi:hypothetical protein